jgi:hypothetical protein
MGKVQGRKSRVCGNMGRQITHRQFLGLKTGSFITENQGGFPRTIPEVLPQGFRAEGTGLPPLSPPTSGADHQGTVRCCLRKGAVPLGLFPYRFCMHRPGADYLGIQRRCRDDTKLGKAHVLHGPAYGPYISRFLGPGKDDHHIMKQHGSWYPLDKRCTTAYDR